MRIGLDAMGGDFFPQAPVAGAAQALPDLAGHQLILYGQAEVVQPEVERHAAVGLEVVHCPTYVSSAEKPMAALKEKPDSSIAQGIADLKAGKLDAFLSTGSTGYFMASAIFGLGLLPGVQRPCVGALYPVNGTYALLLDVGINAEVKPKHLAQFGRMGTAFMQSALGFETPRVALLNVGEEPTKGTQTVQEAYALLAADPRINFIGNAEGRDLIKALADVYVTDGFTGNILLKFAESFFHILKAKAPNDPDVDAFNFEQVGGLPLLGVNGTVIVGHGISGPDAIANMIHRAVELVENNWLEGLRKALA